MTRNIMKKISPYLFVLAAVLLSACAGEVRGHVFLDKNGNEKLDSDEKGISKALYEVERDDQPFTSGLTDENGMFFFKKKDKGDYCVKIVNTSDRYITTAPQLTKEPVAGKVAKAADTGTDTGTTSTAGTTDTGSTTETKKEEEKKETPPPAPLPKSASLKNCIRLTGYSDGGLMDVFVGQDVSASIVKIPAASDVTVAAGNTFELKIWYPNKCKLNDIQLPDEFTVADGQNEGALTSTNMLNLSSLEPQKTEAIIPNTLTEMAVVPVIVKLKAPEDIIGKEATYTLKPQVKCPDGNIVALNEIKIKVQKERNLFVEQESMETEAKFGGTVTFITSVHNKGAFDLHDDAIMTITLPPGIQKIIKVENNVDNSADNKVCSQFLGSQVTCNIGEIKKDASFKVTVKFQLPSAAQYPEGYKEEIKTELHFYDEPGEKEDDYEGIDIPDKPIYIPAPPAPPEPDNPAQ